jgi:F-type H+-transporting ATPase subunit alpha
VAGDLRLSYTQFQELESFARFGTRLDQQTKKTLEHGKRVREALKQNQLNPMGAGEQIAVLLAVTKGLFDDLPVENMAPAEAAILDKVNAEITDLKDVVAAAGKDDPLWEKLVEQMTKALHPFKEQDADTGDAEQEDQDRPRPSGSGQDHEEPGSG